MSCNHEIRKPTLRIINGCETVSLQCQICGSGLASPKSKYKLSELPAFDDGLRDLYDSAMHEKWKNDRDNFLAGQIAKNGEWWVKYDLYLTSWSWKVTRQRVLDRDRVCQRCFDNPSTQAHHLSYSTYNKHGFTFPSECVGVCNHCHDKLHKESQ